MSEAMTNALLLNINEQLGAIQGRIGAMEAQLKHGAELHKTFQQQIDMIDRRTDIIEDKTVKIVDAVLPENGLTLIDRVRNLEVFRGQVGAAIVAASTVIGTGISLLWWGITWIASHWQEIKSFFTR